MPKFSDPKSRARTFIAPAQRDDPFGIYVHIPFCAHICPYCDFNTYAGQDHRIPAYVEAACREAASWSEEFAHRAAASIFIGGGTPSLLTASQISALLRACGSSFAVQPDAEITIEANPNDLSQRYCLELLEAGVNRISIGAQTLDRRGLRVLGRRHETADVANAVSAARRAGFANISLDFIHGWPGQTVAQLEEELTSLLSGKLNGIVPEHLSLYGLIVEPGTPMADAVQRGIMQPADDDLAADLYERSGAILRDAGWVHYEIANWSATPALASRHNAVYWRNGDYAGLGAGAHGHVGNRRSMNQPSPRRYVEAVMSGRSPATNSETIDARTELTETMMLGLRLLEDGVSAEAFQGRHGLALDSQFAGELAKLNGLGLIEPHSDGVRLTAKGALLANAVAAEFVAA